VQVEAQLAALDAARVQPGDAALLLLPNGATARGSCVPSRRRWIR